MNERSTPSDRLMEAIDACRPGSDDLSNVEFTELTDLAALVDKDEQVERLYHRIQQLDTKIAVQVAESFSKAPVPEGLAERILDALVAHDSPAVDVFPERHALQGELREVVRSATMVRPDALGGPDSHERGKSLAQQPSSISSSRRLWFGAALAASLAGLAACFFFWPAEPDSLTATRVYQWGEQWYQHVRTVSDESWQHDLNSLTLGDLKASKRVALSPCRWQWLPDRVGSGIVYDLTPVSSSGRVFLFVVKQSSPVADLPFVPPREPSTNSTEGHCVAAWQSPGVVYILVVEGSRGEYHRTVNTHEPQIA